MEKTRYKGKVGISAYRNRLRLSLPRQLFGGKQKFIYLGLTDSPENRKLAEAKAWVIESDIRYERFDATLVKYSPAPQVDDSPITLIGLYERYINSRRQTVRPTTWNNGYRVTLSYVSQSPFSQFSSENKSLAQQFTDWASLNLTPETAYRLIIQINAAYKWGIATGLLNLEKSPFEGLAKRIKPKKDSEDTDINPFTAGERDAIIQSFSVDNPHYLGYVKFCFFTGCRPSEALGVKWSDVAKDYSKIIFNHAVVRGEGGQKEVDGLKTQKKRIFPCNEQVKDILQNLPKVADHLFIAEKSTNILSIGTFRKKWKATLLKLGIEYRNPYQTRHTFITLCLEAGMNAKDVGHLVGNSPQVIYKHYAGVNNSLIIPEL